MTLSVTWRSARKFPSNVFCVRAFARELQTDLLGEIGKKPRYPEVEVAFHARTGAELGRATWSEWWNGRRVPNATYRTLIDNAFDGLASRWLYRSLDKGRLQRHLSGLDIGWLYENASPEVAEAEAWDFLIAVVHDWAPCRIDGKFLPAVVARGELVRDRRDGRPSTARQVILPPRREQKSVKVPQEQVISMETVRFYEPLNPASILNCLLRFAAETRLPDRSLREAFTLDFLTAVNACFCLLQMVAPHLPQHWGRPGEIFLACEQLFWLPDIGQDDPFWELNEPFGRCIWPLLEEINVDVELEGTRQLFHELKDIYLTNLAVIGLDAETVIDLVRESLGCNVWWNSTVPHGT